MNEPLHPLTLSEILDKTAQLYRSRFLVFVGIAAIPVATIFVFAAGMFAIFALLSAYRRGDTTAALVMGRMLLGLLIILVAPAIVAASALGEAAMTDAAARFFLGGTITIRNSFATAWKRGWRFIGLFLLQGLMILAVPVAALFIAAVGTGVAAAGGVAVSDQSSLLGGIVLLLAAVLGCFAFWMLLRICLAFAVCIVEHTTAWTALKRSIRLSHGTRGRILLLYLLGLVLNQILSWAVLVPIAIAVAMIPGLQGKAHAELLGTVLLILIYGAMFMVRGLTKPVYGIALTLFYFDQRIRKEGFDIEWMMQQAGMNAASMNMAVSALTSESEVAGAPVGETQA